MYNNYNLSIKKFMNFTMWVGLYIHTRDHIYIITYIKV